MKTFILFFLFTLLCPKINNQMKEISYYRKDIGMYFNLDNGIKRQRIPYMLDWDFYASLKNDSVMVIQDIKKNVSQLMKEYKISSQIDTVYVKEILNGKKYKIKKKLYRALN